MLSKPSQVLQRDRIKNFSLVCRSGKIPDKTSSNPITLIKLINMTFTNNFNNININILF